MDILNVAHWAYFVIRKSKIIWILLIHNKKKNLKSSWLFYHEKFFLASCQNLNNI